jgi:broad specificity phosphatase PhoE/ribonuclease HI
VRRGLSVIVEADGGARGNPGPAGYGALVREAATGEVLVSSAAAMGIATNNVAEYAGLIAGLTAAAELGAVEVEVRMDSKLVVEQMSGRWQIKNAALRDLAAKAAVLVARFESVRFVWIPRHLNTRADALANAAMDGRPDIGLTQAPQGAATDQAPRAAPRSWTPPGTVATRLVLVRHGETEFTEQRRYSGRGDVPLTERGREQASALGRRLTTVVSGDVAIISSPLGRCVATAEEIGRALAGTSVIIEDDLVECDFGDWEGLTFADVRRRWPSEMEAWLASTSVAPPGGESFEEVAARVGAVLSRVFKAHVGETVILVSHVSPIKLLLRDALAARDDFLHRLFLDAAGISIVDTWPDGNVAVRTVNDTAHLA